MGGNATGIIKSTGEMTRAEKVSFLKVSRSDFIVKTLALLSKINELYYKKFKEYIWNDERILRDGTAFNGSTSFIMNTEMSDEEILKYKNSAGDIDVTVPDYCRENLWKLLDSLEDKKINNDVIYKGCSQETCTSIIDQINTVFEVKFRTGTVFVQIDFELMPFENNKPNAWTKFSHSSSLVDYQEGIKGGVFHKLLIRSIVGGSSIRDDVIIAMPKSTPDNIIPSKSKKYINPRFLSFSVMKGVREVFEPLLDDKGNIVKYKGKEVYKEKPAKNSKFEDQIDTIFKLTFKKYNSDKNDLNLFNSFIGVIQLMKKYLSRKQIQDTHDRFIDILWGTKNGRAQELERDNPDLDYQLKYSAYNYLCNKLNLKNVADEYTKEYYKDYGQRGKSKLHESFSEFLSRFTED